MEKVKVEWIPAHLMKDSPAEVSVYFDSRVITNGDRKVGFFRGRELIGRQFSSDEYVPVMVNIQNDKVVKIANVDPLTIWSLTKPECETSLDFLDMVEIGDALSK